MSLEPIPIPCNSHNSHFNEVSIARTSLVSPNYPNDYDSGLNCKITYSFSRGLHALIVFDAFEVGTSYYSYYYGYSYCSNDYLEIRDGNSSSSNLIGNKLCATNHPGKILSTGNSATVVFHTSSYYSTFAGFKLTVYEVGKCNY